MNADTPRLTTNAARVRHLNSVHGVYLKDEHRELGLELLPLASLNSVSLLSAELVGRSYGGGVLKIEPREADSWSLPSKEMVIRNKVSLRDVKVTVGRLLAKGDLQSAVQIVDEVMLADAMSNANLKVIRAARQAMSSRRITRGQSAG
jgi:hypothetical protein